MEPPVYFRRREDKPCTPVEWELDIPALLDWLNGHDNFASRAFCIRDALLVGRPVETPEDLRLVLVFHHLGENRIAYAPFDFHQEDLRPFFVPPVQNERCVAQ